MQEKTTRTLTNLGETHDCSKIQAFNNGGMKEELHVCPNCFRGVDSLPTMQEKTLEELRESIYQVGLMGMRYMKDDSKKEDCIILQKRLMEDIISLISSREEKAREEDKKKYFMENYKYNITMDFEKAKHFIITQYKEELLGKLEKRIEYFDKKTRQAQSGKDEHSKKLTIRWSAKRECLSEIKKIIN